MERIIYPHSDLCRLENKLPSNIENLIQQVELLEDYEKASQALMDVVHQRPHEGARLALNIISSGAGDIYLRSFAFSMLYRADRAKAFDCSQRGAINCESEVFAAMLMEVAEDVGHLRESQELRQIVSLLQSIIPLRRSDESISLQKSVEEFLKIYGTEVP